MIITVVDDTTNGNGNLTYKIGLLTADEIAFAGYSYDSRNTTTYLEENTIAVGWWTLSPSYFYVSGAAVWIGNRGYLGYTNKVPYSFGLRPSISLVSSTSVTGDGTSEDPYVIN